MKKVILIFMFIALLKMNAQNLSNGNVLPTTTTTSSITGSTVETFRFGPKLVTQSDFAVSPGNPFSFGADRQWFSIGRLDVGTTTTTPRTLYGFRLQRAGKGLSMGYSGDLENTTPTVAGNPFIEWIGNDGLPSIFGLPSPYAAGNLEFYTASNPSIPTSRKLSFTLNSDLTALFGTFSTLASARSGTTIPKLEINAEDRSGLLIDVSKVNKLINYGAKISIATSQSTLSNNFGLFATLDGSTVTNSFNCGIYASVTGNALSIPALPAIATTGTFAGYFNGLLYSSTQVASSDASLKKDVKIEISNLEKITKLNPVTYNYIQKNDVGLNLPQQLQHGFIAQELEKVFPELVLNLLHPFFNEKNEQTGTKSLKGVNYNGLISVLVASVKELNTEIVALKEKLANNEKVVIVKSNKNLTNSELDLLNEKGYYLGQNTPNPFKTSTIIEYSLPNDNAEVSLMIFNLSGQTIKEYRLTDKKGTININQGELTKGLYLYSLISNGQEIATKKMLVN
jgi:Chaperone of endosialidase/Secretion system C-terminal sorting domain